MLGAFRRYLGRHHVAFIALALVLLSGGSAYAAATIGASDIKANAVRSKHIKDGSVTGDDVDESSLAVGRVVGRLQSAASLNLTAVPQNYVLSSNTFQQKTGESISSIFGQVNIDQHGCTTTTGFQDVILKFKVDGNSFSNLGTGFSVAPTATLGIFNDTRGLVFEGIRGTRLLTVDASIGQTCNSGGPVEITGMLVRAVGVS